MKKKILTALTALFILGLAAAVFAFNRTNNSDKDAAADCCQKSDSCPMKNGGAKTGDNQKTDSCCDSADCCCKSNSCPMKKQGENASANCCAGCGDSCPMKDKQSQTVGVETKNVVAASGESCCKPGASCCDGGACCKHKG